MDGRERSVYGLSAAAVQPDSAVANAMPLTARGNLRFHATGGADALKQDVRLLRSAADYTAPALRLGLRSACHRALQA
jgi:hypothetical protein